MTKPKIRMHADGQVSVYVGDGFSNFLTGLGMADIKASAATYVPHFAPQELEAAYRTSTWFGKIVDIPADDATREWRVWQLKKGEVEKIEAEERRLGLKAKVRQARIWQRLYGGAALILGVPGDPAEELNPEDVGRGGLQFVTVVTNHELTAVDVRRNPLDPFYALPERYEIQTTLNGSVHIHPSRVIPFRGVQVASVANLTDFWGDPIWYRLESAIKSADGSGAVLDALLQEAKVDVLRVSGMMQGMATAEYEALMVRRFQMVAILKGMQNVMMLDKDDEWAQKQITWTGLPDIAKHILNILSGAANIPMFRLTGQNLTGLNGTGDAETRAYYDDVRADQNTDMRPTLDPLDNVLVRSALGNYPEETWYEWMSLYQMSDREKAEIDKLEAETAATYASTGLVPLGALAKAVQARMIDSGRWPALDQALEEEPDDPEEPDAQMVEKLTKLLTSTQPKPPGGEGDQNQQPKAPAKPTTDSAPRTLYVSRRVLNWKEIAAHFKAQGFETTVGDAMHVIIVYSRTPVDWMKVGASWSSKLEVPEGGPRVMEAFGEEGEAKVLAFLSEELNWRHQAALDAGASYDFPNYQPHITVSYAPLPEGVSLEDVEPWTGPIVLGPEIFKEIEEDWKSSLVEDKAGKSWHTQPRVPAGSSAGGQWGSGHSAKLYGPQAPAGGSSGSPGGSEGGPHPGAAQAMGQVAKANMLYPETVNNLASGEKIPNSPYQEAVKLQAIHAQKTGELKPYTEFMSKGEENWKENPNKKALDAAKAAKAKEIQEKVKDVPPASPEPGASGKPKGMEGSLRSDPPPLTREKSNQREHADLVPGASLTLKEKAAITAYTGSQYVAINGTLRSGKDHPFAKDIDSGIAKHRAKKDMVLARGFKRDALEAMVGSNPEALLKPGVKFTDKGYVSTTRKADTAENYAGFGTGYAMKVSVKKGSTIAPVRHLSKHKSEDEYVLPRNSTFRVSAFDKVNRVIYVDLVQ